MIWLFLVPQPFIEVVPNGTTQGWVRPTWHNLVGQYLNATWLSLGGQSINATWHLTNQ
jgi:hypothetical protein